MPKSMTELWWRVINVWNKGMCHYRPHTCRNACYWLGWGIEGRPIVEHSVGLADGTEADRCAGTSDRTCLQWRKQTYLTESTEFCDSSRCLIPTLNAQRWDWRSLALHGFQDIKGMTIPCLCCVSTSGGQVWPTKCTNLSNAACIACSMRATCPKLPYTWLLPLLQWTFCMWTLPA